METEYQLQIAQKNDFIEATKFMEKDMEVKTTLYNHMKEQIDGIKEENVRLSQRLQVNDTNHLSRRTDASIRSFRLKSAATKNENINCDR